MDGSGVDAWLQVDDRTDKVTQQVLIDMLELLKEQVAVKRWKSELSEPQTQHDARPNREPGA